ncbi:MAG: FKBP-type peptidyl-prolyl cis-trans isomerase N-terminal domain-containing protein, partial [gamma proteobacterium symbiont of Lucinoma myriamae]|nr:FKBP-type peptidyl-prolyl cis-trans isomerase N-terminal domain-containing protein [gamma proteobacterium symbiont of Lucinoma myriamae]
MSNSEYTIKTDADKVSYGIGLQLAQQVKSQSFPGFSLDSLIIGLSDVFNRVATGFSPTAPTPPIMRVRNGRFTNRN